MYETLRENVNKRVALTKKEWSLWEPFFTHRSVRKRQFLMQAGEVCGQFAFVNSGCLRLYSTDPRGEEHVLQFAIRDWWIGDMQSYLTGEPAAYSIDALHDSEILLIDKSSREKLLETAPKAERFFRLLLESHFLATNKRIDALLRSSAEERYLAFLKTYPALVEEIPLHQVASYLGITPQSLSRIRKDLSRK
jgi:CRP-like cAMP-binding protein